MDSSVIDRLRDCYLLGEVQGLDIRLVDGTVVCAMLYSSAVYSAVWKIDTNTVLEIGRLSGMYSLQYINVLDLSTSPSVTVDLRSTVADIDTAYAAGRLILLYIQGLKGIV